MEYNCVASDRTRESSGKPRTDMGESDPRAEMLSINEVETQFIYQ